MKRRQFITLLGGAAVTWPLPARAQQPAMPVIGFLRPGEPPQTWVEAFQQSLRERGYVDGQNVVVKFLFTDAPDATPPPCR
jgi:putative tryptophan/tyrosine transport system substrate-binding protein